MAVERILLGGDLHKRGSDISTIKGYRKVFIKVQYALMDLIRELKITKFISLGDWYDKGYQTSSESPVRESALDQRMDQEMNRLLNGEFYGLIGNHIRLGYASNPETILIQPNELFKVDTGNIKIKEQVIKTPKVLTVNGVDIHFMHNKPDERSILDYKPELRPDAKYNIALFHTDHIISSSENFGATSTYSNVAKCLEGLDLAIAGHWHKPREMTTVGKCNLIIPGSLTNSDSSLDTRHTVVNLPVIEIDDDGKVSLFFKKFGLFTDELVFKNKTEVVEDTKLKSLRSKTFEKVMSTLQMDNMPLENNSLLHIGQWMMTVEKYSLIDVDMVKTVIDDPHNIDKLVDLFNHKCIELDAKKGI